MAIFIQRPLDIAEYYLNILFLLSILWMIAFFASVKWGKIRKDVKQPVKSLHASNRWLKGNNEKTYLNWFLLYLN